MFLGLAFLPLVILAAIVLLVLAGKNEPDPKRERPKGLYLAFAALVGVVFLLGSTFLTANGLVELTDTEPTGFRVGTTDDYKIVIAPGRSGDVSRPRFIGNDFGREVNHDDDVSQVVGGVIAGVLALALLRFFSPKLQAAADNSEGPGARIYARYLYVVCGVTLITALGAAGTVLYSVFGMIAPDTSSAGQVTDALRTFLSSAVLAAVAAYFFRDHWQRSEDLAAVADAPTEPAPAPAPAKKAAAKKAAPPKA